MLDFAVSNSNERFALNEFLISQKIAKADFPVIRAATSILLVACSFRKINVERLGRVN